MAESLVDQVLEKIDQAAKRYFTTNLIGRWGSGMLNIIDWCVENGNPTPAWSEQSGSVYVTFTPVVSKVDKVKPQTTGEVKGEVTGEVAREVTGEVRKLIGVCLGPMTRNELQTALKLKGEENFRKLYLVPALDAGLIEMTIPDKPRSSKQKYRLTEKGQNLLVQLKRRKK